MSPPQIKSKSLSLSLKLFHRFLTMPSVSLLPPSHQPKMQLPLIWGYTVNPQSTYWLKLDAMEMWFCQIIGTQLKFQQLESPQFHSPLIYVLNSNMGWNLMNGIPDQMPPSVRESWPWTDLFGLSIQVYTQAWPCLSSLMLIIIYILI